VALAREGACLIAVGRNEAALETTVATARQYAQAVKFQFDLTLPEVPQALLRYLEDVGRLDILIHSAGVMHAELTERAPIEEFDSQYAVNVRAPYVLTQQLLPRLIAARGQIVFINSSVGLAARQADLAQYSASKHALKAVADSLREEVNPKGVRVLSLYLGRTATPMQESRFREEKRDYHPELLMQPEDVARMVIQAICVPGTAEVTDISMRPVHKSY